jgi:hypothetical protein
VARSSFLPSCLSSFFPSYLPFFLFFFLIKWILILVQQEVSGIVPEFQTVYWTKGQMLRIIPQIQLTMHVQTQDHNHDIPPKHCHCHSTNNVPATKRKSFRGHKQEIGVYLFGLSDYLPTA